MSELEMPTVITAIANPEVEGFGFHYKAIFSQM